MSDSLSTRASTAAELTIATQEGVLFRLPLAGPVPRFYAMLLDIVIVLGVVNGIGVLAYWVFAKAPGFGVMVITLTEFTIGFAYGALLEGFWNGQTIGKRLFHLRVIDQSGLPLRIEQAWVRNLMRVFDALPFAYLVGGISVLSSSLMQRFGDRVAGTLVVRQHRWPCRRGTLVAPEVQLLRGISCYRGPASPGGNARTGQPDSRCAAPPKRTGALRAAGNLSEISQLCASRNLYFSRRAAGEAQ